MEQFQCGTFDTAFFFHFSTSMSMWTRSMDYNTRANSSTQVFLQYICNWSEDATSVCKSSLEVGQMTALYICVACEPLRLFWISADYGWETQQKGVWK